VSFVGRNLRGVAYLQLNAAVNPGNSGGPLLDAQGRVVGMVSLKINESDGLGLALPVEYFRPAVAGPAPADEAAPGRWSAIKSRAEAEDAEEVARLRKDLSGPVLVAVASSGPRSIELSVMQRWTGRPEKARLAIEVQRDGQVLCRPTGRVEEWADLAARVKKAAEPPADGRTAWLLRNDLLTGVHGGGVDVSLERCPDPLPEGARLRLEGAEGERAWFRVPAAEPTTDHERELWRARERAEARRQLEEAERRVNEEAWRKAFKDAREKVAELEKRCAGLRRDIERSSDSWSLNDALRRLPEEERQLRAARKELAELERLASSKGVPREWR
jgi:serine protease Do